MSLANDETLFPWRRGAQLSRLPGRQSRRLFEERMGQHARMNRALVPKSRCFVSPLSGRIGQNLLFLARFHRESGKERLAWCELSSSAKRLVEC